MNDLEKSKWGQLYHDLGAPISAIKVVADILPEEQKEAKDLLFSALKRLDEILQDIASNK